MFTMCIEKAKLSRSQLVNKSVKIKKTPVISGFQSFSGTAIFVQCPTCQPEVPLYIRRKRARGKRR